MLHITKLKPLFTGVLTTAEKYDKDVAENGLIVHTEGELKLYQRVIAIGSTVRDIAVGDKIVFDPKNYMIMKYDPNSVKEDMGMNKVVRFAFPFVNIFDENDKEIECLLLNDRDIRYVYEGEERFNNIIIPDNKLIV